MKYILTFIAFLTLSLGFSQTTLRKSSLSAGGGSATQGAMYMVYALGEIGVQEHTTGTVHLSEGFVGPDITAIVGIEDYGVLEGLKVFPNPVRDNLQISLPDIKNYEVHIFDLTGQEIFNRNIDNDDRASYNISNFKAGVYLLVIVDRQDKLSATVKLQKL